LRITANPSTRSEQSKQLKECWTLGDHRVSELLVLDSGDRVLRWESPAR